jgi:hypothetical protein
MWEHNGGDTASVFTSWTRSETIAIDRFVTRGGRTGGILLELRVPASKLVFSPDRFHELEVLIEGPVHGAIPRIIPQPTP